MTNALQEKFKPVAFDPKQTAAQKRAADPAFRKAYDALEDEFAVLAELLKARKEAGLTQADVAQRMGVSQPVLARIESSLGSRNHAPSLSTLRRYAQACGKRLVISMVWPQKKKSPEFCNSGHESTFEGGGDKPKL